MSRAVSDHANYVIVHKGPFLELRQVSRGRGRQYREQLETDTAEKSREVEAAAAEATASRA